MTWWRSLAVLFLVVAAVVCPRLASASRGVQLETRVGGIDLAVRALVGGSSASTAEKHLENSHTYDEIAPGYAVAAEGIGGAAEGTISVFHGSIGDGASILESGLDAARAPTFVSRDIAAAQDVLANHPNAVPGLGQIIESRIPASQFNRLLSPFERPYGGFYPYGLQSTEIPLRSVEQIELFNQFIVGF